MKILPVKIVKKLIFLFSFLIFGVGSSAHPFYVSICQIDFNKENRSLEISVKTFANDLLLGLDHEGEKKIYLGEENENPETGHFIFEYIKEHLKIKVNGTLAEFSFIGKEIETDVVWSYLEIAGVSELNTIQVECSLLIEVFDTQSNIIQVDRGDGIKNMLLNKQKTTDSITF